MVVVLARASSSRHHTWGRKILQQYRLFPSALYLVSKPQPTVWLISWLSVYFAQKIANPQQLLQDMSFFRRSSLPPECMCEACVAVIRLSSFTKFIKLTKYCFEASGIFMRWNTVQRLCIIYCLTHVVSVFRLDPYLKARYSAGVELIYNTKPKVQAIEVSVHGNQRLKFSQATNELDVDDQCVCQWIRRWPFERVISLHVFILFAL